MALLMNSNLNVGQAESVFSPIISNSSLIPLRLISLASQKNRQYPNYKARRKYDHPAGMDLESRDRGYSTLVSNSTFLPLLLLTLSSQKNSPSTSCKIKKSYDYIVVGGGTAGSVVAARLSEEPCVSVLLLEAGPPTPKLTDILAIARNFWFTDIDWQYKSVPQRYTGRGLRNRQVTLPSGKTFGGSSVLNGALHVRGNRKDYDDWAAMGAEGWSYEDVLPYFKKLEDNKDYDYVANGYHGVGGPVTVMRQRYEPEIKEPVFLAAQSMGYKIVDPNARRQTGFYDIQVNMRRCQRCSTGKAYLVPSENRTNLDILSNAFVRKVIIQKRKATGVSFDFKGHTYKVRANREVIVSAGAINTPQILMLSGIGPKDELHKFNIPVHADLPVGRNLMDHGGATVDFLLRPYIQEITQKLSDDRYIKQFIFNRTGPLCSTSISNMAFLRNDEIHPKKDYPNYEIYFSEGSTATAQQDWNLRPEVYQQVYAPYENSPLLICFAQLLHPRSRGTVKLSSSNPFDPPLIDPNYLQDPRDVDDIVEGMKTCRRISTSYHMRNVVSGPLQTLYPGCERFAKDEDAYFRCQVRTIHLTLSHYSGTAKMGHPADPTTVLDAKLRVKGIKGLRVADTSIMPRIVSGNTGVPAIMIGEKASDIIKETIQCYQDELEDNQWFGGKSLWNPSNFEPVLKHYEHQNNDEEFPAYLKTENNYYEP